MTLSIASGETRTIPAGSQTFAPSVGLGGGLNLGGSLSLSPQVSGVSTVDAGAALSASATPVTSSPVQLTGGVSLFARSLFEVGLPTIPSTRFHRVASGERTVSPNVNLGGSLFVGGSLNLSASVTEATAMDAGSALNADGDPVRRSDVAAFDAGAAASGTGERTLFRTAALSAGAALPVARSIQFQRVDAEAGATLDADATPTAFLFASFESGARLSADGTAFANRATATIEAGAAATGSGTLTRSAGSVDLRAGATLTSDLSKVRLATALFEAGADAAAESLLIRPAVRREDADLVYDDSDDFDLGLDG